jgi:hypothetical protein
MGGNPQGVGFFAFGGGRCLGGVFVFLRLCGAGVRFGFGLLVFSLASAFC